MPRAGLGDDVRIWITETGYATRGGSGAVQQAADLEGTLNAVHDVSGTLGISDVRYFNLRDNRSAGTDLFDAVGLLYDDYRPKPAFGILRAAIDRDGVRLPLRLRVRVRHRRVRVRVRPPVPARLRLGRQVVRADARGRAVFRLRRARRLRATYPGYRPAQVIVRTMRKRASPAIILS